MKIIKAVKLYKRNKAWLSNGILKSIKKNNVLYKKSLCYPTLENINNYKKYKSKLNHVLRTAKRSYHQKGLNPQNLTSKQPGILMNFE